MKSQKDLEKKIDVMTSTINRAVYQEANTYWRKHIPVYGWTNMNSPGRICGSLLNKYQKKKDENKNEKQGLDKNSEIFGLLNNNNINNNISVSKSYGGVRSKSEIVDIVRLQDPAEKFMNMSKIHEFKSFQEIFSNYNKNKKNVIVNKIVPHNLNAIKEQNLKKYVTETGQKTSYIWLTTDPYEKKMHYVFFFMFIIFR